MLAGKKKELMIPVAANEGRDRIGVEHAKMRSSLAGADTGMDDLIMRTSEFESKDAGLIQAEVASAHSGMADFEQGRRIGVHELSKKIRERYGL